MSQAGLLSAGTSSAVSTTLLSKQVANNSASISFTSFVSSAYATYIILFRDIVPVTNNVNLQMTVSTNNGSSYLASNYEFAFNFNTSGGGNGIVSGSGGGSAFFEICDALSNVAANGMSGQIQLFDINTSNTMKYLGSIVEFAQFGKSNNELCSGVQNSTTPINAIQFSMSSGNISSGTFTLLGVVEP